MLQRLKKAYYNRKPVVNPRKKKTHHETSSTEEGHDDKLKSEMKAKKANLKNISALLKASFSHRRKWINGLTGKGAVKKVLEEYPGFNKYNQVSTKFFSLYILAYNVDKTLGVHAMIGQTPMLYESIKQILETCCCCFLSEYRTKIRSVFCVFFYL